VLTCFPVQGKPGDFGALVVLELSCYLQAWLLISRS